MSSSARAAKCGFVAQNFSLSTRCHVNVTWSVSYELTATADR